MNEITLRAPGTGLDALLLGTGMHPIGRSDTGNLNLQPELADSRVCLYIDRRGIWLAVGEGVRGVHVNGRPIQRKAMLRLGDSVHVDGNEIVLVATKLAMDAPASQAGADVGPVATDPRVVLRGSGGRHHGRSFTLDQPRLVGSASDADIRIADPAFSARHARIGLHGGQVVLQMLATGSNCLVNGEPRLDALLQPGDQVVFDSNHRFVVEAPLPLLGLPIDEGVADASPELAIVESTTRRLPWLLLAAVLIAASISALLLL
ncbi:MAG: FHA domain-containing protein [Luteimonas sp.]